MFDCRSLFLRVLADGQAARVPVEKYIFREVALQPPPPPPLSRAAPAYRRDDDNNNIILHFNDITIMCYRPVSYPKRVSILNIIIIWFIKYRLLLLTVL